MEKVTHVLAYNSDRVKAIEAIKLAPVNSRVTISPPKRSLPQNDHFHAILAEIANQAFWKNKRWSMEAWKRELALKFAMEIGMKIEMMPSLTSESYIPVVHTSKFSREEGKDFIEYLYAFGAEQGVIFKESKAA